MKYSTKDLIEKVYKEKYDKFVKQAYNILKQQQDAEDAVQEAFCRALKYQDAYNDKGDIAKWISGIVKFSALKVLNDNRMGGLSRNIEEDDVFTDDDLGEVAKTKAELVRVIESIKCPTKRQICYAHFIIGDPVREIQAIMPELNRNAIKHVLYKFNKDLKVRYV